MKRPAVVIGSGLLSVAVVLGLYQLSEHSRERRHAKRPQPVADELLRLAQVNANDRVYDLECGEGTVVITAAVRYGAHGWCFDIYPQRLAEARERARQACVERLITFQETFWDRVDVAPATVVVLWLTNPTGHIANYKLCGQLTSELPRGARIIAYGRGLGDWTPLSTAPVPDAAPIRSLQLWITDGDMRRCLE